MAAVNFKFIIASVIILIIATTTVGISLWYLKPDTSPESNTDNNSTNDDGNIIPDSFRHALILQTSTEKIVAFDPYSNISVTILDKGYMSSISDFNFYRNKTVYYSLIGDNNPVRSISKEYPNLKQPDDNWFAKALAIDFGSNNVYIYDELASKIYVFDMQGKYYAIVLSEMYNLMDIALDPYSGLMLLLRKSSILMANMDGTELHEIVQDTGITAFTLDLPSHKLYWANENAIMRRDYVLDTSLKNYRVHVPIFKVATPSNKVLSLAVLGKQLYYVTQRPNSWYSKLFRCTMTNGMCKNREEEVPIEDPFRIKAYHQPSRLRLPSNRPCEYYNGGCEHLCTLTHNDFRRSSCACKLGWQLAADLKSCLLVDEYVLYVRDYRLYGRTIDLTKEAFTDVILPTRLDLDSLVRKKSMDFDYNARKGYLVFSDDYNIFRVDLTGMVPQKILQRNLKFDVYLAVDWISDNLYYLAANRYDTEISYLIVRSTERYSNFVDHKVIRTFPKGQHPRALVIHPNLGYLFVTVYDETVKTARIYRLNSDGSGWAVFVDGNSGVSVNETGLGIDYTGGRLYWFDEEKTKVQHVALDGYDLRSFDVSYVEDPVWINVHHKWIYISNRTSTWRVVKKTGEFPHKVLPKHEEINVRMLSATRGYGVSLQPTDDDHPCAVENGGCNRYCFAVPTDTGENRLRRVCACNNNEELKDDGKTCVYSTRRKSD